MRGEQRYMFNLAEHLLDPADAVARTVDVLNNETTVTRTCTGATATGGLDETVWRHARAFLRVDYVRLRAGVVVESEIRMYV